MDLPKVSIIVPVYNAEKTIKKCLNTILTQTLREWEAIIVDDGSFDASGLICDNYAIQDQRFHVIHKANAGVSAARQDGLNASNGEYIIHVDPDDWIEPQMLEELYNIAKTDNADMVICDFNIEIGDRSIISKQSPSSYDPNIVLNDIFGTIHGSCCNKLIKKSCIDYYSAKFPEGIDYCEDVCFNVQLLKHNINISYINKAFYHYVQHSTSITNNYTLDTLNSQKQFISFLTTHLPEESYPISRSKEIAKKFAFRYNILSDKDFIGLYPEITSTSDNNFILNIMYRFAFTGHFFPAKILRKFYLINNHLKMRHLHKKQKNCFLDF